MRNVTTSRRRACRSCFFTSKFWFAECKWDVSIANHVLQQKISWIDLSPKNLITNVKFQFMKNSRIIILTLICRFIVMQNNVMKYMTRIGQKTGMLKKSKNVQTNAMTVAFVAEYQNLNSGNLQNIRIN